MKWMRLDDGLGKLTEKNAERMEKEICDREKEKMKF